MHRGMQMATVRKQNSCECVKAMCVRDLCPVLVPNPYRVLKPEEQHMTAHEGHPPGVNNSHVTHTHTSPSLLWAVSPLCVVNCPNESGSRELGVSIFLFVTMTISLDHV